MKVILLEKIAKLGGLGNVVNVKKGFARNFLLPQKKALRATEENIAVFENQRKDLEVANEKSKKAEEAVAAKMNGQEIVIIRQASDTGVLYGSVSTRDIATELVAMKFNVVKSQVVLNHPIKEIGVYSVQIQLHPEVVATVKVNVARSVEEAEAATAEKVEAVKPAPSTVEEEVPVEETEAPAEEDVTEVAEAEVVVETKTEEVVADDSEESETTEEKA